MSFRKLFREVARQMKRILSLLICGLFGSFLFTGCVSGRQPATPAPVMPTPTQVRVLPTPAVPGDSVTWQNLQVNMEQADITDTFVTDFGSQRDPSAGQKFLWVHVRLKNVGKNEINIPAPENFSVLYVASEFKPIYGHRQGYVDYITLDSTLFPEQEVDAWLRFDIPVDADLKNLWFVFLPDSSAVGISPSSPNYPWANDHTMFAWLCAP